MAATYDFKVVQLYASYEAVRKIWHYQEERRQRDVAARPGVPVSANGKSTAPLCCD